MKNLILTLAVSCLLCACATSRKLPATTVQETTNRNVDVKYEKVFVHDTTYIKIPAQTAERTTQDSTSRLENDYAISVACINADGTLFHSLNTKPQKKPVPVCKEIERKDSIIYVDKVIPVYIEKELGRWEKTCIRWFPYLLVVIILAIAFIFRTQIHSIARRIL